jgi:two-component system NarL family sensor kinase
VGWVAEHGESVRVGDVSKEPRYLLMPAAETTQSELAVPIRAGDEVLGVLNVESTRLDAFDASDEATLVILGDHVGTAVQNARLFEQQHSLAVAEEGNRLAREIHDTLAQGLTAITLQLEVADALLDLGPDQARPKIQKALELTRGNLEEARRSVMDLRAAPLQERTLPAALEALVSAFGIEHGLRAEFAARNATGRLPSAVEAGLYRIAQEALNNVQKHANATSVRVTLERVAPPQPGEPALLRLIVEDDGTGFEPTPSVAGRRKGAFGLVGMQERARLLGGKLEVTSAPGSGTQVLACVPARGRADAVGKDANETNGSTRQKAPAGERVARRGRR